MTVVEETINDLWRALLAIGIITEEVKRLSDCLSGVADALDPTISRLSLVILFLTKIVKKM